mmetsp:Transcript_84635/g.196774  ORF Transcript_84635/g.196774 Transcript_84635/m.196774 type:complete len:124 (+) Transcript_84635:305-676(+)
MPGHCGPKLHKTRKEQQGKRDLWVVELLQRGFVPQPLPGPCCNQGSSQTDLLLLCHAFSPSVNRSSGSSASRPSNNCLRGSDMSSPTLELLFRSFRFERYARKPCFRTYSKHLHPPGRVESHG